MLEKFNFVGSDSGSNILFLGAIHGDEICGKYAIERIIKEIDQGIIYLKQGKITFVPVSNPEAFAANKRYINKNLNRVIRKYTNPSIYEEYIANEICDIIDENDIIIDLHSFMSQGSPFVFQDYEDAYELASFTGMKYVVKGWPQMYEELDSPDTIGYAYSQGKKGILVECGVNGTSESIEVAYSVIKNILGNLGIIDHQENLVEDRVITTAQKIFFKKLDGRFSRERKHLNFVKAGEIIGIYEDGEIEKFEKDGYILLPNSGAKAGEEWFYYGAKD